MTRLPNARVVPAHPVARYWQKLAAFYREVFGCIVVPPERLYSTRRALLLYFSPGKQDTIKQTNPEEGVMKHAACWVLIIALIVASAGCTNAAKDVTIVTKAMRSIANESTAGAPDLGISVPSSGNVYWVEGQVKNGGTEEVRHVTITFRVTDGNTNTMLRAEVPAIPAGKTVSFRTVTQASRTGLRLIDEAPEISVK